MFIAHRVNTIKELNEIPTEFGVEVDIRDYYGELVLDHDPFIHTGSGSESFEDYLKNYKHSFIILNIKSERLEYKVLELLKKYSVTNYFFLDSSFPMMVSLSKEGEKNIAVRYSEYESIYTVTRVSGMFNWVWADCFTKFPLNHYIFQLMKINEFKVCVVSPELQGQPEKIKQYIDFMIQNNIKPDMVCDKIYNYDLWKEVI